MKALSVRQPWAWAIVNGYKKIENRRWRSKYVGPLLIHAGEREDTDNISYCIGSVAEGIGEPFADVMKLYCRERTFGAVIGVATMIDCVDEDQVRTILPDCDISWFEGPFGFLLEDARPIDPIPLRGMLGIFNVDLPRIP